MRLEQELESQHQKEMQRLKEEHSKEMQSLSLQSRNDAELRELREQNKRLVSENEYLKEAQERYQILQRSFTQLEKNMEQCSINSEVEERLRPMIDREVLKYRDQNEQLIA